MATTKPASTTTKKPRAALNERIKKMLNQQALTGKLTLDELSDLEQAIKRLAVFLGAPA